MKKADFDTVTVAMIEKPPLQLSPDGGRTWHDVDNPEIVHVAYQDGRSTKSLLGGHLSMRREGSEDTLRLRIKP